MTGVKISKGSELYPYVASSLIVDNRSITFDNTMGDRFVEISVTVGKHEPTEVTIFVTREQLRDLVKDFV